MDVTIRENGTFARYTPLLLSLTLKPQFTSFKLSTYFPLVHYYTL